MTEQYFYAKIGEGNSLAGHYLGSNNEIQSPAIPIYFDGRPSNKAAFLNSGKKNKQAQDFFACGENSSNKNIVIIHDGLVTITQPLGNVIFATSAIKSNFTGYVKLLPVKISLQLSITEVPAILASLTANRYYFTGTFRQIKDEGNFNALESIRKKHIAIPSNPSFEHILNCLSSFELETLIAKILEEAGCFVPAYRGGNMKGADIFAFNDSDNSININGMIIDKNSGVSIQVKRNSELANAPVGINYLAGIKIKKGVNNFDYNWFYECIKCSPQTTLWLKRSLCWLPKAYLTANGLI